MRKTIWKYRLQHLGVQTFTVPADVHVLSVQRQRGNVSLWAEVDPDTDKMVDMIVRTFGTGHNLHPDRGQYVGTYQTDDGALVFHVYVQWK